MDIAIITSSLDTAGINIRNCLLKGYNLIDKGNHFELDLGDNLLALYQVDKDSINCDEIDKEITAELFVFATKHQSSSGINSLSVHVPGNWADAGLGGRQRELCVCPANALKSSFLKLLENAKGTSYDIIQECTHHGPFITKPCMFIEIGSNEQHWKDENAGRIIAKTIIDTFSMPLCEVESIVGIGGLHTTPNFKKIMVGGKYSVGHVCPKYMLDKLDSAMILQAMERTIPKSRLVVLDWKGLKDQKNLIVKMIEDLGVDYTRTDKF